MARAAIVVVPSRWSEPFGLTALEALACGAALLCSPRGGLPEVYGQAAQRIDPTPDDRRRHRRGPTRPRVARDRGGAHALGSTAGTGGARELRSPSCRIAAALDALRTEVLTHGRGMGRPI